MGYYCDYAHENAFAKSFTGRLRDECLNEKWFVGLKHASEIIGNWQTAYDEGRAHGILGGLTHKEYTESAGHTLTAVGQ